MNYSLDVGGTEIKAAALDDGGGLVSDIFHFCSKSEQSKEVILNNFADIFSRLKAESGSPPQSINLAFPGDFDYKNGICLIKNVGKYDALYKMDLKAAFHHMVGENVQIDFINDVEAFGWGETREAGKKELFVCIGTGCGSAFFSNNAPAVNIQGVPPNGWIYPLPYRGSCIDDYISIRGLSALAAERLGLKRLPNGRELYELCAANADSSKACFSEFGDMIAEAITPILDEFKPDFLVFGGQLMTSFDFFHTAVEKAADARGIRVRYAKDTSKSAIYGLYKYHKHILKGE